MASQPQTQEQGILEDLKRISGLHKSWIYAALVVIITFFLILSALGIISFIWSSVFFVIASMIGLLAAFQHPEQPSHKPSFILIHSGPLPSTDENFTYFNQALIEGIYEQIIASKAAAIVLTGSPGVGKSTLAAQLYNYAEKRRSEGDTTFTGEALWGRVDPGLTMGELSDRLLRSLGKSIPNFGHLPPQNQALAVSHALSTSTEARLVFLDQFENLLAWGRSYGFDGRPGVEELLYELNQQNPNSRLILTSDAMTWKENEHQLTHLEEFPVGLDESESLEFLKQLLESAAKQMVPAGKEVQVETDDAELKRMIAHYRGNALALKLLASILIHDGFLNPKEAVHDPGYAHILARNNAAQLLDYIYQQQLDVAQQQLLLAFSIYREPVDLAAAQAAIMIAEITVSQKTIESLLSHSVLLSAGGGRYYLHPVVTTFARKHFNETDEKANQEARQVVHGKAAQHYRELASPNASREGKLPGNRLHLLVEAIWHLCHAGQFEAAYKLMEDEKLFSKLSELGHNAILLELYQLLLPLNKWHPQRYYAASIYNNLGEVYGALEKPEEAHENFQLALPLFIEEQDYVGEARVLHNLGSIYSAQGQEIQFWGYLEQSWDLLFPSGRMVEDAQHLRKYHQQSIEANDLLKRAMDNLEQASAIRRDEGEYHGLCRTFHQLGRVYNALGERELALKSYKEALEIARSVEDLVEEGGILQDLGRTYNALGRKERARALDGLEQARRIQVEQQDLLEEGITLNSLGRVYDEMGEKQRAWSYYWRALAIGQQVGDRKGVAVALHNIGALYFEREPIDKTLEQMLAFLLLAKDIFEEIHSPMRERAERQIEALREKVGATKFDDLVATIKSEVVTKVQEALVDGLPKQSVEASPYILFTQSHSKVVAQRANKIVVGAGDKEAENKQDAGSAGTDKETESRQDAGSAEADKEAESKQDVDSKEAEIEN
jgi:tetratricopeptide (TPR) repeat protein